MYSKSSLFILPGQKSVKYVASDRYLGLLLIFGYMTITIIASNNNFPCRNKALERHPASHFNSIILTKRMPWQIYFLFSSPAATIMHMIAVCRLSDIYLSTEQKPVKWCDTVMSVLPVSHGDEPFYIILDICKTTKRQYDEMPRCHIEATATGSNCCQQMIECMASIMHIYYRLDQALPIMQHVAIHYLENQHLSLLCLTAACISSLFYREGAFQNTTFNKEPFEQIVSTWNEMKNDDIRISYHSPCVVCHWSWYIADNGASLPACDKTTTTDRI